MIKTSPLQTILLMAGLILLPAAVTAQTGIPSIPAAPVPSDIPPMADEESVSAGVILKDEGISEGYTLIAANGMKATSLINNDGFVVHQWTHGDATGMSAYLLPDGSLLRTVRKSTEEVGDAIQKISWSGEVLWEYTTDQNEQRIHHDIEPLPNGNVLATVWERIPMDQYIAAGRNPETVPNDVLWLDTIHEIRPTGKTGGEVVWRWTPWDHIIQDFDETRAHYGDPALHPDRIDLNQLREETGKFNKLADWLHINSVSYHPERDTVLLSSQAMSEIWMVSRKSGKLVYRYGNPRRYGRGTQEDQVLFNQHDANTVPAGYRGAGHVLLFNNVNLLKPAGSPYSSVLELKLPFSDTEAGTELTEDGTFPPCEVVWEYTGLPDAPFYSPIYSSAQRLQNGGTLIGVGAPGRIIELDAQGNRVWEFVNPRVTGKVKLKKLEQWNNLPPPPSNAFFRAYKYAPDYPAFSGKDLSPKFLLGNTMPPGKEDPAPPAP